MKYFLPLLSLFILMSCSSSDDDGDNNQGEIQETLLLKKVLKDGALLREFEYYADNKLKSQVGPLVDDQIFELFYEYVSDTVIVSFINVETSNIVSIQKSYQVNSTSYRTDLFNFENDLSRYSIYTFNNNGCGASIYEHFSYDGTLIASKYFDFIDENCSVNTIYEGYGYKNSTAIKEDKNSPLESIALSLTVQETLHNVIEKRVWGEDDQLISSLSSNSEYEYNSDDYPTKETRTYLDGTLLIFTFEYY